MNTLSRKMWRKTAKGEDEMRTRKYGLAQNLRRVLILIDGISDEMKVLQKGSVLPDDVQWCLRELARQEYIHDEVSVVTAADVKNELMRIAWETLGPDSGKVVEKLRYAPDYKEGLAAAVKRCEKLARVIIDEKKADQFIRECADILEQVP